jgi:2-polyprenyl-6-methoxyphenol hydroxylase-like FAD-dependent oxidoreductase
MGDIMFLSNLIKNYNDCGLDIGSSLMLEKFQKNRKWHINKMVFATDGLNKLFLMRNPIVKMMRRAGLSMVEKSPKMKDFFMQSAGGL